VLDAVLEEDRVHTVLERAAVLDQVQAEARPLAFGAHLRVGQPDLGHELESGQLGEHPGVDRVRLAGERCDPARLERIRDPHVPAAELELVVDEASAAHRLDAGDHTLGIAQLLPERVQPFPVGSDRTNRGPLAGGQQRLPVEALAAEVQSRRTTLQEPPFVS